MQEFMEEPMNEKVMEQMVDHREELVKHEEVVDVEEQA